MGNWTHPEPSIPSLLPQPIFLGSCLAESTNLTSPTSLELVCRLHAACYWGAACTHTPPCPCHSLGQLPAFSTADGNASETDRLPR